MIKKKMNQKKKKLLPKSQKVKEFSQTKFKNTIISQNHVFQIKMIDSKYSLLIQRDFRHFRKVTLKNLLLEPIFLLNHF